MQVDGNMSVSSNRSSVSENVSECKIPVQISLHRKPKIQSDRLTSSRKTIKRKNNVLKALELPKVMNINPRSIYNKADEFCQLLEMYESDVVFMSETWERKNQTLD